MVKVNILFQQNSLLYKGDDIFWLGLPANDRGMHPTLLKDLGEISSNSIYAAWFSANIGI